MSTVIDVVHQYAQLFQLLGGLAILLLSAALFGLFWLGVILGAERLFTPQASRAVKPKRRKECPTSEQ